MLKAPVVRGFACQIRAWLRKRGAVVSLTAAGVVFFIAGAGVFAAPPFSIVPTPTPIATPTSTPTAESAEAPKPRSRLDALGFGSWSPAYTKLASLHLS